MQNELCREICGERLATVCRDGCMRLFAPIEGVRAFSSVTLHGKGSYDIAILNDGRHMTTLLYPLERRHNRLMLKLRKKGLTARECEIVMLAMDGLSNAHIAERLFISKPTVRTHLNNLYKKLADVDFNTLQIELGRRNYAKVSKRSESIDGK